MTGRRLVGIWAGVVVPVVVLTVLLLWWRPWFKAPATVMTKWRVTLASEGWLVSEMRYTPSIEGYRLEALKDGWKVEFSARRGTFAYVDCTATTRHMLDTATGRPPDRDVIASFDYDDTTVTKVRGEVVVGKDVRNGCQLSGTEREGFERLTDEVVYAFMYATR
jgi:hypothetical protein